MTDLINKITTKIGLKRPAPDQFPPDLSERDRAIYEKVAPFTMTSVERVASVIAAADHVTRNRFSANAAIVECGVWRGGSTMAMALALIDAGETSRPIYLYDTFEGMSEPTSKDLQHDGREALAMIADVERGGEKWCAAGIDDVRANIASTGYPMDRVRFVKGKVEETIPDEMPESIAILRLDTDWYESTKHELEYLYPRLVPNGVLILDDYGHWQGCREAVDEYFGSMSGHIPFMSRIDYTGRVIIKPA